MKINEDIYKEEVPFWRKTVIGSLIIFALDLNPEPLKRAMYYVGRGISVMITFGRYPLPRYSKDKDVNPVIKDSKRGS